MDKAVFLLGPTGVGKSELAISLAKKFDGEIISADSVAVYKGFDIGSAKPSKSQMQGIKHHMIDVCTPSQRFTVQDFVLQTRGLISQICSRGHLPIVVGGTGLYVKALLCGFNFGDTDIDQDLRQQLDLLAQQEGALAVWKRLEALDKQKAQQIPVGNVKRVIRAIEVLKSGGKTTSKPCDFQYRAFAISMDRQLLYQRINQRVDVMVQNGLVDEVKGLLSQGVSRQCQPMQAIGYKEVVAALDGKTTLPDAITLIKQHSRNYAKRQFTYLRTMPQVTLVDWQNAAVVEEEIQKFVGETK